MSRARIWALAVLAATAGAGTTQTGGVQPAGGPWRRGPAPPSCPPVAPLYPPGAVPWAPPYTPTPDPKAPDAKTPDMKTPDAKADPTQPPTTDSPFAQPTPGGGESAQSFNESFNGDFGGVFYTRTVTTGFTTVPTVVGFRQVTVGTQQVTSIGPSGRPIVTSTPITRAEPIVEQRTVPVEQRVRLPLGSRYQGVFITDYDSPRPQDRVYFGYTFYSDIGKGLNTGLGRTDLQRQMAGFEKTLLNENASFGMRIPFVQQYGPGGSSQTVGDLSLLAKYAFYNNRQTGDLASVGFVLTTPTGGGSAVLLDGTTAAHSVLFQPWAGFVRNFGEGYVQGLSNLIIPSDGRDPALWGNSVAVGYWLYRNPNDRFLTGITPAFEAHLRTPLNHRNSDDLVFVQDQLNLTAAVHVRTRRGTLSPGLCVPVMGPRPWAIEAMCYAQFTF